jgi:DNA-binding NarL/FixJ family response regulator
MRVEIGSVPRRAPDELTARESEVAAQLSAGRSNAEIADQLGIAESTVARHVSNILAKTGLRNRTEISTLARRDSLEPS